METQTNGLIRIGEWMAEYEEQLRRAVAADEGKPGPEREYAFSEALVPVVAGKMKAAFERGSFNKEGRAIRATCKAFKIPHTYKAIRAFLEGK